MLITYDADKRFWVLEHRGLDFEEAALVLAGATLTIEDDRRDYGETRYQSLGLLHGRPVMVVWTPRGAARHIITMWKANERDRKRYKAQIP
jgi:uncharacterized DUF497 family protein